MKKNTFKSNMSKLDENYFPIQYTSPITIDIISNSSTNYWCQKRGDCQGYCTCWAPNLDITNYSGNFQEIQSRLLKDNCNPLTSMLSVVYPFVSTTLEGSAYKRIYNPAISRTKTKVWMVSGSNVTVN